MSCRTEVSDNVCISDCSIFIFRQAVGSADARTSTPWSRCLFGSDLRKWNNVRSKAGSTSVDSNSVLNWNYCVQSVGLRSWFLIQVEESGVSIPVPNEEYQIRSWMSSCRVLEQNSFSCLLNFLQILQNLLSTSDLCTQSCRSDWLQSNYRHNSNRITAWKLEKVRGGAVDPPFQFETVLQQAKPSILTTTDNAATFTFPWLGWNVFPLCTSIMKSLNS